MPTTSALTLYTAAPLVRLLAELDGQAPAATDQAFAEQLSQLFNFADAAILADAQQRGGHKRCLSEAAQGLTADQAEAELAQLRTTLTNQIVRSCALDEPPRRLAWPRPKAGQSPAEAAEFEPYLRFYLMLQRELDTHTRHTRAQLRAVLAQGNPRQQRLAALDAAFDDTLWRHARRSFGAIPLRLRGHFQAQLDAHRARSADQPDADDPLTWAQPGGWLAGFMASVQTLLLAELDVRLQPLAGLLAALRA